MISNQVLQSTLEGLKQITHGEFAVTEPDGRLLVQTSAMSGIREQAKEFAESRADALESEGSHYFKVYDDRTLEYVLVVRGEGIDLSTVGKLAAFQLAGLLVAYREKYDKDNFLKNLLLDNLLLVDVYSRAAKLHIRNDVKRAILCVEAEGVSGSSVLESVKTTGALSRLDFPTIVDEEFAIILHEMETGDSAELNRLAVDISEHLTKAGLKGVKLSYGNVVGELKDVSRSYKEAKMALSVGKIFYSDQDIFAYATLGIGRLIYQLPIPLCRMFIKEIFDSQTPDEFDAETLLTIDKFFENSLNVSETSRQLFIHRNTLVYRLDKIQKGTGLDLRVFEDAITFKIALMVVKYMKHTESSGFYAQQ